MSDLDRLHTLVSVLDNLHTRIASVSEEVDNIFGEYAYCHAEHAKKAIFKLLCKLETTLRKEEEMRQRKMTCVEQAQNSEE